MNNKLFDTINTFWQSSFYKKHLKIWMYKDMHPVLEGNFNNRRFVFHFQHINEYYIDIKLNWSTNSSHYTYFFKVEERVLYSDIEKFMNQNLLEVFNFIEKFGKVRISVIVPIYNRENIIPTLIESLSKQTLDKDRFEVIFVDDCSTDNTALIIKYLSRNLNYTILNRPIPSGGASAPRNDGILAAHGDYIFFVDSDDYILEDTLLDIVECADKNSSDIIYVKLDEGSNRIPARTYIGENVNTADIHKDFLLLSCHPSKAYRTGMIRDNSIFFNVSIQKEEGMLFLVNSLASAKTVSILREKTYYVVGDKNSNRLNDKKEKNKHQRIMNIYNSLITTILSIKNLEKRKKLYNSLLYIFVKNYKKNILESESIDKNLYYYRNIFNNFEKYNELFDKKFIYKDNRENVIFVKNKIKIGNACIKVFYWNKEIGGKYNLGDILSKYIVENTSRAKVVYAKASEPAKICAIGSIINDATLQAGSIFWGTGTHYPKVPFFDTGVEFRAVRGPVTRRIVQDAGYSCPEIYGDPALLLPEFYPCERKKEYKLGIISHYVHRKFFQKNSGVLSIDILRAENDLFSFVNELCQCEFILSSSLHGIIIANAYGIPARWFQVEGSPLAQGGEIKFIDYFESVKMPVQQPLIFAKDTIIDENMNIDINSTVDLKIDLMKLKNAFPHERIIKE